MTRLLSYSIDGQPHFGVVDTAGTGVVDLGRRMPDVADLTALVAAGRLADARTFDGESADVTLDAITFERPLAWPGKIFCIGVNYGGRAAEYTDTSDAAYPSVFPRFPDSFTGHDRDLVRPPESSQLDYEGEIVVVIGRGGRRIPVSDARDHIAALTLGNEGTIRDWVRHAKFNVTQGKNWMSTGAIGPWLVPIDEFGDLERLHLTTHVNGELRQDDTPATMKYPIDYQIHYLSTFTELRPGDLVFTGTPTGAGARFDPPVWLEPGDVIEVTVPEIGTLRNTVVDEFASHRNNRGGVHRTGAAMTSPPMRPFTASLPMALLQAREAAMRLFRPLLAEHDLTEQQWRVLRALTATDAPVDAGELAERTFLLAPSLSRILANLEERDLIVRSVDPSDQRRTLIALTDGGVEQVRQIAPESEQRYAAIEEAFGAERLTRLLDELYDLAALDLEVREEARP